MSFVHTHSSSRFDRALPVLLDAVRKFVADCDLLTLTEVSSEAREKVLRVVAQEENWAVLTGDLSSRDDCAIMYDKDIWKARYVETREVTNKSFIIFGHTSKPVAAISAILEHLDTGKLVLVSVCHLPSSVEGKKGLTGKVSRVHAWRDAHRGWRRRWNQLAKRYKVDGVLVCGDWNINIKRKVFQVLLKGLQPAMRPTLDYKRLPVRGTHGNRLIDFTFIRGDLRVTFRPIVAPQGPSSDHKPYQEGLGLTPTRR